MVRTKALLKQLLLQNKNQNKAARKTKPNTGGIKKIISTKSLKLVPSNFLKKIQFL